MSAPQFAVDAIFEMRFRVQQPAKSEHRKPAKVGVYELTKPVDGGDLVRHDSAFFASATFWAWVMR
jgi:hypothetical protein